MAEQNVSIIGRDEELDRLKTLFDKAIDGQGQTVFIAGDPGIGKSALSSKVYEWANEARAITVFGQSNSRESSEPYDPFRKVLASLGDLVALSLEDHTSFDELFLISKTGLLMAHLSNSDDEGMDEDILSSMLTAVQDFVKDSFGDGQVQITGGGLGKLEYRNKKVILEHGDHVFLAGVVSGEEHPRMRGDLKKILRKVEDEFGGIISDWDGDLDSVAGTEVVLNKLLDNQYPVRKTLESMNIEAERLKTQMKIQDILGSKADKGLVVVLEDLHWADETTLLAIPFLARNMRDSRVMFLCTYEPEDTPPILANILTTMRKEDILEEMKLEPLSLDETEGLIQALVVGNIPEGLVDGIYEDNVGNPFFTIEVVRAMQDTGILYQKDDIWIYQKEKSHLISATSTEIFTRQLNSMSMEAIHIIEFASVLGATIDSQEISIGMDMGLQKVRQILEELRGTGLLHMGEEGIYTFKHGMVQDAIYSGLSERWHGILHMAAGNALEFIFEYDIDSALFRLAHHFARSSEFEKGITYSIEAGDKAANNYAPLEATRFYEAANGLIERSGMEKSRGLGINMTLAELYELNGIFDQAILASERASSSCTECGLSANIDRRLGSIHFAKGDYDLSIQSFERAIQQAKQADDELLLAGCYGGLGKVYLRKGEYDRSLEIQTNYLEVSKKMGINREIGQAYLNLGGVYWHKSDHPGALRAWEECLEYMKEAGDEQGITNAYNNLGVVNDKMGRADVALDHYEKCIQLRKKIGDVRGVAMVHNNIGIIMENKGNLESAIESYKKSLEIRHRIGDMNGIANAYNNLGSVSYHSGKYDSAINYYRKYLQVVERIDDTWGIAQALNNLSEAECDVGHLEDALKHCAKAIEISEEHDFKDISSPAYRIMGSIRSKLDTWDEALEYFNKSIDISREVGEPGKLGKAYLEFGTAYFEKGDTEKAMDNLQNALDIFEKAKMKTLAERARKALEDAGA